MKGEYSRRTRKMESSEVLRFRRTLELAREEGVRSLDRLGGGTRSVDSDHPKDVGDRGITSLSEESLFQQSRERRLMVRMIEAALARIQQGIFGVCGTCGEEINSRRLDALPWAEYCLRCQEGFEQKKEMECPSTEANQRLVLRRTG